MHRFSKNYRISKHEEKYKRLCIRPETNHSHILEIKEVKSMKYSSADEKNSANKAEFKEYFQRMPKAIQEK